LDERGDSVDEGRRLRSQLRTSNSPSSRTTTNVSGEEGSPQSSNTRGRITQPDAPMALEERKKQLASAKRVFNKLARSYLDNRAPPNPEIMKESWKFKDVLDLKSVFTWCDEVGIKNGVLYEDGKVEFEKWPTPPHASIINVFENMFNLQFSFPWMTPTNLSPVFSGTHTQGNKDNSFLKHQ
jgi:hypothetical protein